MGAVGGRGGSSNRMVLGQLCPMPKTLCRTNERYSRQHERQVHKLERADCVCAACMVRVVSCLGACIVTVIGVPLCCTSAATALCQRITHELKETILCQ